MLELLEPLKPPRKSEDRIYNKLEFFADYRGSLDYATFSKTCDTFFELASLFVLKGGYLTTPVGGIKVKRLIHTRSYVDLGKLRNRDQHESIFRDKSYHDIFDWSKRLYRPYMNAYEFKTCHDNERAIPQYEDMRTYNNAANALQNSIS